MFFKCQRAARPSPQRPAESAEPDEPEPGEPAEPPRPKPARVPVDILKDSLTFYKKHISVPKENEGGSRKPKVPLRKTKSMFGLGSSFPKENMTLDSKTKFYLRKTYVGIQKALFPMEN